MEQTFKGKSPGLNKAGYALNPAHRSRYGRVILFNLGNLTFVTFGALVGLGAFVALLHTSFFLGTTGGIPDPGTLSRLVLLLAFGIPVSAYLVTRILDIPAWLNGEKTFTEYLRTVSFGLWGGLIGGLVMIILFTRMNDINGLHLLDAVVLGLPLAQFFGRWGCLNYGCCHGREVKGNHHYHIRYFDPMTKIMRYSPHLSGKPLYPTQIYAMILNLALYTTLLSVWLLWPAHPTGFLAALYMIGYGMKRFIVEFFRGEFPRVMVGGFSLWQWLSLGFIVAGTILVWMVFPAGKVPIMPDYTSGWDLIGQTWPILILAALVMSLMYGLHGRKIGTW